VLEEEAEYSQEEGRDQEYDEEEDAGQQAVDIGEGLNMRRQREVDEDEDYSLKFPKEYHGKNPANSKVVEQIVGHDGKIQRIYASGKKEVIFNNGVKRESFPDGYTIVYFNNKDIKQTFPD
jgi:centromere protein J